MVNKSLYHTARVNVSRNAFFSSRSEKKNIFFDVDIAVKNMVCTLIDNEYVSLLFSQAFFRIVSAY